MGKKKGGVRIKQVGPKQPVMPPNPMEALQIPQEEMVNLPPPPDRNLQIFWPIHETFSMQTDGFQVIYPSYLDSSKTVKQGRRIAASKAVPTPTVSDISLALQSLQVRHVLQPHKGYSRDISCDWDNPGRVLVDVLNYKKKELLIELGERIPHIPERQARLEREAVERKELEEKMALQAKTAAAASTKKSTPTSAGKKKGKKGRKK